MSAKCNIAILFSIHIKAECEHGRKVGFSPILEEAGGGTVSKERLPVEELLENVFQNH